MPDREIAGSNPDRSALEATGRAALALLALLAGWVGVRLLTAVPGHGSTRRAATALQGLSRLALLTLRIRVVSRGSPRSGPALVVANHVCWLDVLVLAAIGPTVPLIDEDVLQRSLIGPMARRIGALLVRGGVSRDLSRTVAEVTAALRSGHRVLVFPECGRLQLDGQRSVNAREQFSRAAFQAAVDAAVVVAPVALSYRNPPIAPLALDDIFGSIWRILRAGPLTVRVTWLPVIPAVAGPGHRAGHRDAAARRAEWAIARALGEPIPRRRSPILVGAWERSLTLLP